MQPEAGIRVVLTTFPDSFIAERVIRELLKDRLIACATMLPQARSMYEWNGKIEDASEVQCILKTTGIRLAQMQSALMALHPYQVPELIVLAPESNAGAYGEWIQRSCGKK